MPGFRRSMWRRLAAGFAEPFGPSEQAEPLDIPHIGRAEIPWQARIAQSRRQLVAGQDPTQGIGSAAETAFAKGRVRPVLSPGQVGCFPALEMEEHHFHPWGRVKICPSEMIGDITVKPWGEQQRFPCRFRAAHIAFGSSLFHNQPRLPGRMAEVMENGMLAKTT